MSKLKHIEMLLRAIKPVHFSGVAHELNFFEATSGSCSASFSLKEEHTNHMGGLHGGFSAALIDIVSSAALLVHPNTGTKLAVSANLNLSFIKGAKAGDELIISSRTLKSGKSLAFLEAEIRNKATNDLLVRGEHTKFYLE